MFRSSAGSEPSRVFKVADATQVSEARRGVGDVARACGFGEMARGQAAIVATELGTNLAKHAGGGMIVARPFDGQPAGLDLIGLDRGPGIRDMAEALRDGYSTAGSPGTGLGAIRRLAATFDVHTQSSWGTAVLARLHDTPASVKEHGDVGHHGLDVDGFSIAGADDPVCGDAWAVHQGPDCTSTLVVDGLGHGGLAADAAREAVLAFRTRPTLAPEAMMEVLHGALRGTRGAAAAVAQIDQKKHLVRFAGIGNIAAVVVSPAGSRYLASHNGIVGHNVQRIDGFSSPWTPDSLLVQHSDGLGSRWSLDTHPGLVARQPALVAAVLYRDYYRGRDDVTVLVARGAHA